MQIVINLMKELGISKVSLAKYLGVSRQMVYNYLEMESLDDWPKDKKTKLLVLFGVEKEEGLKKLVVNNDLILRIDEILSDIDNDYSVYKDEYNVRNLTKKNQKLFSDIIQILKEKMTEDKNSYHTFKYLYSYLQLMDDIPELKYSLAYYAKTNGVIPIDEYVYDSEPQIMYEGIMYQANSLFNGGGFSKAKVLETHKKFEQAIREKHEEELSRTQELYTVKEQALKELGYTEINEKNVTEVFQKIAEIQTRKN